MDKLSSNMKLGVLKNFVTKMRKKASDLKAPREDVLSAREQRKVNPDYKPKTKFNTGKKLY